MTITTTTATKSKPLDTFLCVVVVFDFNCFLCPEVGLGFLLLSVQRLV